MFNKFSNWLEAHRGLLALIAMLLAVYLKWADYFNTKISNFFSISLNHVSDFFNRQFTIGTFLIVVLLFTVGRYIWAILRTSEIKIIKATYYTPDQSRDITEIIKKLVEKERKTSFYIDNTTAKTDPEYGKPKKLDLEYEIGKEKFRKTFNENGIVDLV